MIQNLHNVEIFRNSPFQVIVQDLQCVLHLEAFQVFSLSIVNSLIQHLVIPAQIPGFQREVNDVVLLQKRVFHTHGLLEGEPAVVLGIDDHILFLIRYPVQSNLLSLVVCGQHVVEGYDCHILADVLCGDRVLVAGIADEAVFLYPAKIDFVDDIFAFERA